MHIGIDFGTTRTIVAYADRGNYPVVAFNDPSGDVNEYFPSIVALKNGELLAGFDAQQAGLTGFPTVRSFKRLLASPRLSVNSTLTLGEQEISVFDVLKGFLSGLAKALANESTLSALLVDDPISDAVISVPAHAHSAQRFLTLEAFRAAGFKVSAMINEPSAAGFEYTHRQSSRVTSRRNRIIVYDLGGGTFDASRIDVHDRSHAVLETAGLNHLGGDDFDEILADLALAKAGNPPLNAAEHEELLVDAQTSKEGLAPQSKRITVEVNGQIIVLPVDDFYRGVTPLIHQSIKAMTPVVSGIDDGDPNLDHVAGIYLVGGASSLPIVPRLLREHFGRRVQRSPYPAASTAIGLAIASDPASGYTLADRISRGFGVFREADSGQALSFDAIFSRHEISSPLDASGKVQARRRYRPMHNLGHLRFVEFGELRDNQPFGDLVPFSTVIFPYDRALQNGSILDQLPVQCSEPGDLIEERYTIDQHGIISIEIIDLDSGYSQSIQLSLTN